MPNGFEKLAEGIGKAVETVPDVYEDGLKPATQESGKAVALIPRAINAAFAPLRQWIAQKEYNVAETEKLLAMKLENVSPEKIVSPEAYVAIPAIQAISYSMDSEELRNLYANLLANAMNVDTKEFVHPSFVEIIKQMSPLDAKVFELIMLAEIRPLITINIKLEDGGTNIIKEYCSWITQFSLKQCYTSFNSLIRLGLIEIPYGKSYSLKQNYNIVEQNPLFLNCKAKSSAVLKDGQGLSFTQQYIKINGFSDLFYKLCVENG